MSSAACCREEAWCVGVGVGAVPPRLSSLNMLLPCYGEVLGVG